MERASRSLAVPQHPDVLRAIEELQENGACGQPGFIMLRLQGQELLLEQHSQAVHVILPADVPDVDCDAAYSALEGLPLEIKMMILAMLPLPSLASCARVSRAWRALLAHPHLWQSKVQQEFPSSYLRGAEPNTYRHVFRASSWRDAYLFLQKRFARISFHPPTYQQMCALLPHHACRVVLFNLPCDFGADFKMLHVYMVWAPDSAPLKEKLLVVTFANALKAMKVGKIDLEAQASELGEMTLEDFQDNVQRKINTTATVRGVDPSRFVLRM